MFYVYALSKWCQRIFILPHQNITVARYILLKQSNSMLEFSAFPNEQPIRVNLWSPRDQSGEQWAAIGSYEQMRSFRTQGQGSEVKPLKSIYIYQQMDWEKSVSTWNLFKTSANATNDHNNS